MRAAFFVAAVAAVSVFLALPCEADDRVADGSRGPSEVDTSDEAVVAAIDKGIGFLLSSQNKDGSWGGTRNQTFISAFADPGTYHCWSVGTTGLAALALLELGDTDEAAAAAERGLDFLVANADLKRPAEWDVDNVWGLIYGLSALSRACVLPRYDKNAHRAKELAAAAATMLDRLAHYVSPRGGWGYYANPGSVWRPEWATSFTTAAGVIALLDAKEAGLAVPGKVLDAAVRTVERCRLPNGAYSYSANAFPRHLRMESINQVKGSLGRIQVCNHALFRAGSPLPDNAMEQGIEQFFRHHMFLDLARNKPIPHEGYYAVAAYFYMFGHYYASHVIESLTESESVKEWKTKLRYALLKCTQEDGSQWDFWVASSTKPYGTAFAIMALGRTLDKGE